MLPSSRALWFAAALVLLGLVVALVSIKASLGVSAGSPVDGFDWHAIWLAALAALVGFMLIDLIICFTARAPRVRRQVARSLPLGVESRVVLRVNNRGRAPLRVRLYDHHPADMAAQGLPAELHIPSRGWSELRYTVTPTQRGNFSFPCTQLRQESPLGLWWRDRKLANVDRVRVYPNFAEVSKYILLATSAQVAQMGIRKRRRRGQGSEFHQLREFREGDSPRQVDWRATARQQKLISREYQDERDQNIVLLLDCGRRLRTQDDRLSHFDHALNAMLLLAYVALRQGDAVGIATFSGQPRWLKPVRGQGMLKRILNAVYDLEPGIEAPDYSRAAVDLLARQRKRSLVVVLTGIRDEANAQAGDDLLPALKLLQRRHTVMLASLREQAIDKLLQRSLESLEDALTLAATRQYLDQRDSGIARLRANGINCVDVAPQQLSVALVNHYLAMKAGGQI